MALKTCGGRVSVSTDGGTTEVAVAEVRSWSYEETADVEDTSIIDNGCNKRESTTGVTKKMTVGAYVDPTDTTGQGELAVGVTVDQIVIYPTTTASGGVKRTCNNCLITSYKDSGEFAGNWNAEFAVTINGDVITETIA